VEAALACLRRGEAVLVFPEGTRIRRPGLGEPREGVAWLAARARVPVLPVHVRGSWGPERRWFRRGGVSVRIGEPFCLEGTEGGREARERLPEMAGRILAAIHGLAEAAQKRP
jgi:1-acyl-sn-glycerol-3-phosphate acyltransferase